MTFAHVVRPQALFHPLKILVEAPVDMDRDAKANGLVGLDN
jgi:hypothetical protein